MSWWEVLGVRSGASEIEIAAAYRRRAKDVHPDAEPGASLEARQTRERAMARLNLAYAEARSAARAAPPAPAAPRSMAAPTPTRMPTPWPEPPAPRAALAVDDDVPVAEAAAAATPAPRRRAPRWRLRVVAATVVGVAAFVVLTARSAPTTTVPTMGSCVNWSGKFTGAPCGAPHAGRVVAATTEPARCPSGTSFMPVKRGVLCIDTRR